MSVRRLEHIPGFNIDRVAAAAGDDPDVLRLENLDTDIPPPAEAIEATRAAIGEDEANSWLPFTGRDDLKEAVAAYIERRGGPRYDGRREIVITSGEGDAMLDALFCLTDPGDEVVLTDPTYAGMLNRVRLVGAVPRLVPLARQRRRVAARPRRAAGRGDRPHPRRLPQQRVVPVRLGGERRGVGCRSPRSAASATCGSSTGAASRASSSTAARSAIPPALPGMRDRTVTVGAPSLEQRMIAWRVGWVVAPGELVNDVSRVHIYNGLVASGFAQIGTRVALGLARRPPGGGQRGVPAAARRDAAPARRPSRGAPGRRLVAAPRRRRRSGSTASTVSDRLLEQKVAATPMRGWGGEIADRHVRFVFSNEPVERLALLGDRVRAALARSAAGCG